MSDTQPTAEQIADAHRQINGSHLDLDWWVGAVLADYCAELVEAGHAIEKANRCPNCPDQGWYEGTGTTRGMDGLPEPEPIQVQCEWCETAANTMFQAKSHLAELLAKWPGRT